MMKKLILFTTCFMLMSNVCSAEVDLWNLNRVDADFNENLAFEAEQEFRFSDGVNDFVYESSDFGLRYLPTEMLTLGFNFRQVFADTGDGFTPESRPHVNIGVSFWLFDDALEISDRVRTEFRFVGDEDMALRFRNLLTLSLDVLDNVKMVVSDELFVTTEGLDENRLGVGARAQVNTTVDLGLAYQLQTTGLGDDEVTNGHGVLANLYLSF